IRLQLKHPSIPAKLPSPCSLISVVIEMPLMDGAPQCAASFHRFISAEIINHNDLIRPREASDTAFDDILLISAQNQCGNRRFVHGSELLLAMFGRTLSEDYQ